MKSAGYSRESKVTTMFSTIPSRVIVELSASYRIVGVALNPYMFKFFIVSLVMTFIAAPRSIKALLIDCLFMLTFTNGLLGSKYFGVINFPNIMSANCPTTWTMVGSFFFLPGFLRKASLMAFPYIGTSLMSWNRGIWTCMFFN